MGNITKELHSQPSSMTARTQPSKEHRGRLLRQGMSTGLLQPSATLSRGDILDGAKSLRDSEGGHSTEVSNAD